MAELIRRFPLTCYFLLAYALTWAIELPMMYGARGVIDLHLPLWLEAIAAFGPFLAAVIVLRVTNPVDGVRNLIASLLRWRVPLFWLVVTLLSPVFVMVAALLWTDNLPRLLSGELVGTLVEAGKFTELLIMGGLLRGLGEEPGWRGFALPVLRGRHGPLLATFLLWPVWTCWHLPAFLMRPDFELAAWLGFSSGILAATAWTTLIYDKTRSVLMIAVWHALINITRGITGTASGEAFMAFAQVMTAIGLLVIVYWIFARPGTYRTPGVPE